MKILPYTAENLALALSNTYTSQDTITSKSHFRYLNAYLGVDGLEAQSIVIEENYISKDFLHDYASYYAFCFENYPKFCRRIHLFKKFATQDQFDLLVSGSSTNEEFWNSYLGFIVVKPIPFTVIGYTILKTYPGNPTIDLRNFWGIRDYAVHLGGNELKIRSLAFQEQDSILAACATTAIWSMLNKAALDLYTILKSPSQITKDADTISYDGSRLFPNKGLNLLQICQAIFQSGLVSEVKQPDSSKNENGVQTPCVSNEYLKKILNAYSPIGIPVILVIRVPNGGTYGLHAITVSGYKQSPPRHIPPHPGISWFSDNIEKIYAHDDQWGPFSRISLINDNELETEWTASDPNRRYTLATNIIVPVYPKIRISYEEIEAIVLGLDRVLTFFFGNLIVADLVWDIKIDYSETFKAHIKASGLNHEEKLSRLVESLPKYLWMVSCYIADHKVFEFTFDATNVHNGMIGQDAICYFKEIRTKLTEFLQNNEATFNALFTHHSSINYYRFIIDKLLSSA